MKKIQYCLVVTVAVYTSLIHADVTFTGWGELGFLGVVDHKIQFGRSGTYFDYTENGGQDILFPFSRLSVDATINKKHTLVFLYQPLSIETEVLLDEPLVVDGLTFPDGTPIRLTYSFSFYRFSYLYTILRENENQLSIGLSLQLRNAAITFASLDGDFFRTNRDLGPVPALKLRGRYSVGKRVWLGLEADGIYAPVSYINGSDNDVTGAILDAVLRSGVAVNKRLDSFLAVRYLGGGAEGDSEDDMGPGDGYTKNWLHFITISLGFAYDFN